MYGLFAQRFTGTLTMLVLSIVFSGHHLQAEEDATAPLIVKLKSGDARSQLEALNALEDLGDKAAPAAPHVVALLREQSFQQEKNVYNLSYGAEDVLLKIGPSTLPLLAASAGKPDKTHGAARDVIDAMIAFEEPARPWLLPLLSHEDERVQVATLDLIGKRRRRSESWFPQIVATLQKTEKPAVKIAAAQAMEKIAQYARQPAQENFSRLASQTLLKLAAGDDPQVALAASAAVVRIEDGRHKNGKLEKLAPHLLALLQHDDAEVQLHAARYLELSKLATEPVVDALIQKMLQGKSPLVRMMAAEALNDNAYKQPKVIAAMAKVVGVDDPLVETPRGVSVRGVSVAASLTLQNNHKASLPYLKANLDAADERTRYRSARLIAGIQPAFETAKVLDILVARLEAKEPALRHQALHDIARLGPLAAPAVKQVTAMVEDHALAIDRQSPMADAYVHDAAARALSEIGPPAKSATTALAACITGGKVTNPHSLRHLHNALKKIDPQHPLTDDSFVLAEAAGVLNYFLKGRFQTVEKTDESQRVTVIEFPPFAKQHGYKTTSPVTITTTAKGQEDVVARQQRVLQLHQQGSQVLLTETRLEEGKTISKVTAEFKRLNWGVSLVVSPEAQEAAATGDWVRWDWQPMKAGLRGFQELKGVEKARVWSAVYGG